MIWSMALGHLAPVSKPFALLNMCLHPMSHDGSSSSHGDVHTPDSRVTERGAHPHFH